MMSSKHKMYSDLTQVRPLRLYLRKMRLFCKRPKCQVLRVDNSPKVVTGDSSVNTLFGRDSSHAADPQDPRGPHINREERSNSTMLVTGTLHDGCVPPKETALGPISRPYDR